jgi:hypothetical protein
MPKYLTPQAVILLIHKVTLAPAEERLLQNQFKFLVKAAEFEKRSHYTRRHYRYYASPGIISLGGICVGRGRIPFHGPTIRQGVGPRCNER